MSCDVESMKKLGTAAFLLLVTTGLSAALIQNLNPAEQYYGSTAIRYTHINQESVEGTGFVMEYKKVNTNNLSMLEYMHGSGSIKEADVLNAQQKTSGSAIFSNGYYSGSVYYVVDSKTGKWKAYNSGASSVISYTKQNDMSQAPSSFAYGTGWYAQHPVGFDSLLKDKTNIKSYQEGTEMEHQMEYARAYVGDIAVELNCTGPTETADGLGFTHMKIDDDVTAGTIHVAEFLSRPIYDTYGNYTAIKTQGAHSPLVIEDTSWIGNFKIQKDMQFQMTKTHYTSCADWLACPVGGFFDIQDWDKLKAGESSIFDCTARNVSLSTFRPKWDGSKAQFPEEIYGKKP
jgi:hypothetical protein